MPDPKVLDATYETTVLAETPQPPLHADLVVYAHVLLASPWHEDLLFLTPGEKKDTHRMWGHNAGVNANGVTFRFLI